MNVVQANPADKTSKGKNKGKGKAKSDTLKHDSQKSRADDGSQHKPKYPCLNFYKEHYTKDCPRWSEVIQLLKGTQGTPTVLKEPFPSYQTQLVEKSQSFAPFGSQLFMMNSPTSISIATRSKYYTEPRQVVGEEIADGPPPLPVSGPLQIERPNT